MDKPLKSGTIRSLGAKLDDLADELTPDEAAVLTGLLGLASATLESSHDDADGSETRAVTRPDGPLPKPSDMLADTFRARTGRRPRTFDPAGPLSDSIGVGWLCVSWSKDYNKAAVQEELGRPSVEVANVPLRIEGLRRGPG